MLTITRKDLLLTISDNVIPAMGSSDVPVKFINDEETYVGFLIEPRVGYYVNGCPKSGICEYDTSSNIIKIPAEAFKNKGILVIAIALIDNNDSNHIEVTKELALEVTPAPNGTVILPATDTWQTAVKNLVEQLYNQDYKPQFDEIEENLHNLVKEAQNQQNKANNQQTQIDNAIDVMGDYEIVQEDPTQIRFKKGDGTYGDTVNLGDNLASKSMVNAGYDTYSGNSYSGSASDYGIEIGKASGAYEQEGTPTPESPIEPKFFEPKNGYSYSKNMFDFNVLKNNYVVRGTKTYTNDSITLTATDEDCFESTYLESDKFLIKVRPNTKYTILYKRNSSIVGTTYVFEYNINKNMITPYQNNGGSHLMSNFTFTTRENCEYIKFRVGINQKGQTCTFSDFMILEGEWTWETVDKFIPYKGNSTTPLNLTLRALPNGVCDTYEDGIITRRVGEVTFDGSGDEEWRLMNTNNGYTRFAIGIKGSNFSSILCNNLKVVNGNPPTFTQQCIIEFDDDIARIIINNDNASTVEELRTYLQSNPITVWYELKTPMTEYYSFPIIPSYFPYTNAWHDSEVEASDLTWNILARQYGSGQTTIKKDEIVLTELDLNTERKASPTTVKVQLQDSEGKVLYLETSSENVYIQSGRFSGKTVQQVLENSIQAISATDEYIEVDVPDSMTQSIDEEFLVDEVDESETETE